MAKHAATHHLRRVFALALAVTAILVIPATAHAAFAKVDSAGKLTYTAISGEANDLTATYSSGSAVKLHEAGHFGRFPILIGGSGGCSGMAALVTCNGATSTTLNVGDGDDKVAALNGSADRISCGSGNDSVSADPGDTVASDCEAVDRGTLAQSSPTVTNPGTGETAVTPDPPVEGGGSSNLDVPSPFVNVEPPVIPRQTATVSRSGVVAVQVVCPADAGACKGTVALVLPGRTAARARARVVAAGAKPKGTTVGRAKFAAEAGEKPVVQIRLNRRGRRRILRTRHTRCRMIVTTRSSTGKVVTTTRTITLRPRRSAGRAKKNR